MDYINGTNAIQPEETEDQAEALRTKIIAALMGMSEQERERISDLLWAIILLRGVE